MLPIEALNSAQALTDRFDAKGLIVTPMANTPLEKLVLATRSDSNFVIANEDGSVTADVESIEYISAVPSSEHGNCMDEIASTCIEAVQGQIAFARSVVAPVIDELVTRTNEALATLTPPSLLGMEVIVFEEPQPLNNPGFENLVSRFAEVPYDSPKLVARLPEKAPSDIMEYLKTGSAAMDRDIAEWAAGRGDVFFTDIWDNVFRMAAGPETELNTRSFRQWLDHPECGVHHALAIFLLARRLFDEAPEGTMMDLRQYEATMAEYRDQAGARLFREVEEMEKQVKLGLLVRTYTDKTVTVNQTVYRRWIETGGENEILFGNLLGEMQETTVAGLNEKATALKAAWQRQCSTSSVLEANKRHIRTKEILCDQFCRQLQEVAEDERATLGNLDGVQKRFDELLEQACDADLDEPYSLCLRLVCQARFPNSSAEKILSGIEYVKRLNPGLDVREAAALSVINYIADWVGSQMVVRSR